MQEPFAWLCWVCWFYTVYIEQLLVLLSLTTQCFLLPVVHWVITLFSYSYHRRLAMLATSFWKSDPNYCFIRETWSVQYAIDISASDDTVCLFSLPAGVGLIVLYLVIALHNSLKYLQWTHSYVSWFTCGSGLVGIYESRTRTGLFSFLKLEVLLLTAGISDLLCCGWSAHTGSLVGFIYDFIFFEEPERTNTIIYPII